MDAHPASFSKVEFIRIVVGDIFSVLGGNLDKTLHLVIRNNKIFQTRTFLPHHELQEIVAFLEISDLRAAGMYEYEIRNDRNKAFRFHSVIDSYGITFRNKIFQTIFTFEFLLRSFFTFVGPHDEPAGGRDFFCIGRGDIHTYLCPFFQSGRISLVHAKLHIGMYYSRLYLSLPE